MPHAATLDEPFALTDRLTLRNRFVATAHGRAAVDVGIPTASDAEYWARVSAGGVGMCIAGGTVVSASSTHRSRILTEAWRPEGVDALAERAAAMRSGGAAAVLQILHLGRETLGADGPHAPVGPSAVRSPREPTRPRALSDDELEGIVLGFRASAKNAADAGFDGIELHAAHGYLLGQILSANVNRRTDAESVEGRMRTIALVVDAVRAVAPGCALGIRLSVGDEQDSGVARDDLPRVLEALPAEIDWVNLTVGMRSDYVRDMATTRPPLLDEIAGFRAMTARPLLISHGFRGAEAMRQALEAGADMVGVARALIADPDMPRKILTGVEDTIRPCVACNEDCRSFDPALLCSVNPDLGAPGDDRRAAVPLVRRVGRARAERIAVVGAGVAGLEAALTLDRTTHADVVLLDRSERIGGTAALVGTVPQRAGWARLVEFYDRSIARSDVRLVLGTEFGVDDAAGFDAVVLAVGATEELTPAAAGAVSASVALSEGIAGLAGCGHLAIVDDGFSWWPHVNVLELAIAAGVPAVTVVTPGTSFAGGIPAESRVQLLKRLRGAVDLRMEPLTSVVAVGDRGVEIASAASGTSHHLEADRVVVVGERRSLDWTPLERATSGGLIVIGDAVVPRRVSHAIAEGREAARMLAGTASAKVSP